MKKLIKFVIWIGLIISLGLSLFKFNNEFPKQYGYIERLTLDQDDHIVVNFYENNKDYLVALDKDLLVSCLYVRPCREKQYIENIHAICQKDNRVFLLIDRAEPLQGEKSQYISFIDMNKFWFNKEQHLLSLDDEYQYDEIVIEEKNGQMKLDLLGAKKSEDTSKWQIVNRHYQVGTDHHLSECGNDVYIGTDEAFNYQLFAMEDRVGCLSSHGKFFLSDDENKLQKTKIQDVDKLDNGILKIINDSEGHTYALEHNTGNVRRLNLQNMKSELIALGEDYVGEGTGIQYKKLHDLTYQNETHVLGVTSKGNREKLILLNKNEVKQQDAFHMTFENKMNYLVQYFIQSYFLYAVIASVVILGILGLKNCKYLGIKILFAAGILGWLLILGTSEIIKANYGTTLESDVKETLEQEYEYYLQVFQEFDLSFMSDENNEEDYKMMYETYADSDYISLVLYDGELRSGINKLKPSSYYLDYFLSEKETQKYLQQVDKKTPTITESQENNRECVSLYGVVYEKDPETKVIIKIDYDKSFINILKNRLDVQINFKMAIASIIFVLALTIVLKLLLNPIKEVEKGLDSLTMEQRGQQIKYYAKDEVYRISKMINTLSEKLEHQQYSLDKNSENYFKFVPKALFEVFNKNNISDLERGDTCTIESSMALISVDWQVESKDEEVANLESGQILEIIDESVKGIKNIVNVDNKDLADFTVVLMEEETESFLLTVKLAAQLASSKLLKDEVVILDYLETKHAIVGSGETWVHRIYSKRKDFLQKQIVMLKKSNCQLILTEEMLKQVKNVGAFNYRYIGFLQQEDHSQIKLYDFYEQAPVEIKEVKQRNSKLFEQALTTFYAEQFYEARNLFARIIRDDPEDEVARWYIFRCDFIEKAGMDSRGLSLVMM